MQGQGRNALAMLGWAAVAVACGIGLAMSGGKEAPASVKDTAPLFHVSKVDEPKKPAKKKHSSSEPPPMTCEGDQCWWTEMGRPQ